MRDSRAALVLSLVALGCARNPAPRGWLRGATQMQADPYGAWIEVVLLAEAEPRIGGEFLATSADSLYVLEPNGVVRAIAAVEIEQVCVAYYTADSRSMVAYCMLGTASTLSHGFYLIGTAPLWIGSAFILESAEARAPLVRSEGSAALELGRSYARFPGGLPPNLPRRLPPRYDPEPP